MKQLGTDRPVRIADVAMHAGVSTAVVSYVINDGPRGVSAETRARVEESVAALGYRPNRVAQALAKNRSGTIGLIVPDTTNAFFSDLVHAVESAAFEAGILTIIGNADLDLRREQAYIDAFLDTKVDGLIVANADATTPVGEEPNSTTIVYLHQRPLGSSQVLVCSDDRGAGELATRHLLDLGYPTVHCLAGPERFGPVEDRVAGWRSTLIAEGIEPPPLVRSEHRRDLAAVAVEPFLDGFTAPAAIFATTDEQALGLLAAASRQNIRIPKDLAVISCDGTSASQYSVPQLTTVGLPIGLMGKAAVDVIINGNESSYLDSSSRAVFPLSLLEGSTLPSRVE